MIGWPSPRREEELHRHVQRVYATLGAKPAKPRYTLTGVPIRRLVALSIPYINHIKIVKYT